MFDLDLNYLAIAVGSLIFMVVGFVWYAKPVFGNMWMELNGFKESDLAAQPWNFALMIVGSLLINFVLAHVLVWSGADSLVDGLLISFVVWLGFMVPLEFNNIAFEKQPVKLSILHLGYQLVTILLAGALLVSWN